MKSLLTDLGLYFSEKECLLSLMILMTSKQHFIFKIMFISPLIISK